MWTLGIMMMIKIINKRTPKRKQKRKNKFKQAEIMIGILLVVEMDGKEKKREKKKAGLEVVESFWREKRGPSSVQFSSSS